MADSNHILTQEIRKYKNKYFINRLLKGLFLFVFLFLISYLTFNTVEFLGNFDSGIRTFLFFAFVAFASVGLVYYLIIPIYQLIFAFKIKSDAEAAKEIGSFFPEIKDKLLNTLQLSQSLDTNSDLLKAGIEQKSKDLKLIDFAQAVNLGENKKYLLYAIIPIILLGFILLIIPSFITESTNRIINYDQKFSPKAPFTFELINKQTNVVSGTDFEAKIKLAGNFLPEQLYVLTNGRKNKMTKINDNNYTYYFKNIKEDVNFQVEAASFYSDNYSIKVIPLPEILAIDIDLKYPSYLQKQNTQILNTGNFTVPEGTLVAWKITTKDSDSLSVLIDQYPVLAQKSKKNRFQFSKIINDNSNYSLELINSKIKNPDKPNYTIDVIKDKLPIINLESFVDTNLYSYVVLGGNVQDDYGISALKLYYKTKQTDKVYQSISIPHLKDQTSQNYYYRWQLDSLKLQPGDKIEFYTAVWDNDGVNGSKMTRSQSKEVKLPSLKEIKEEIQASSESTESSAEKSLAESKKLKNEVKKLEQKLRSKPQFDYQDKKAIEEMIKKQESLQQKIDQMKAEHQKMIDKQEKLSQADERILEKSKQLQEIMNNILDEETKKLYNELQKLLQEKNKEQETKDVLEKIKDKEANLEKQLDRALEMFKKLKFDNKLNQLAQDLEKLAQKQEDLAQKTEDKNQKTEDIKKEQDKLNQEFEDSKKEMEELKEMNKELEQKEDLESTKEDEKEISKDQKESSESLDKKDKKSAAKKQKDAAEKMQAMKKKLDKMQKNSEQQANEENIETLRNILENLLRLSFDQEQLMKDFKNINQSDPRYVALGQKQLKLQDDSKIIEDSLYALSKRVFQIQSFITTELEKMKYYMDQSTIAIKERRPEIASGQQQFAMTSINNLALLLNDVLKQMQEQQSESKESMPGGGACKKPGKKKKGDGGKPKLSDLQKKLNQQLENVKKSGMTGKSLSQEMAKLARQQEQLRNALKEMEGKQGLGKNGEQEGQGDKANQKKIKEQMEKTEADLVNKRLTDETILRQKEILSKLLEHENALREREQDDQRESQQSTDKERILPPQLQQYLKQKEKQIELLRTISPKLTPYYKQKSQEYFENTNKY